jgi:hypothetical protein
MEARVRLVVYVGMHVCKCIYVCMCVVVCVCMCVWVYVWTSWGSEDVYVSMRMFMHV